MNSAQAIICAIAVCVVITCGSLTYGYLQNDESVINSDPITPTPSTGTTPGETTMATSGTCGTNVYWHLDDAGNLSITGTGSMTNSLSPGCGPWGTAIKTVTIDIPGRLDSYAFSGCTELTTFTVSGQLGSIQSYAFYGCTALTSVDLIGSARSPTMIGAHAFDGCTSLESIILPNGLVSNGVGKGAFANCHALTSISISGSSNYRTVNGVLFTSDMTKLIAYPGGKQGAYSIPNTVTSFGGAAFEGCALLTTLTIPESVTTLGGVRGASDIDCAVFKNCTGLTDLTIPISLNATSWNNDPAFEGCTNIRKITFTPGTGVGSNYDSTGYVGPGFAPWRYSTSLETIIFSEGITSIGKSMFAGGYIGAVTAITIPSTVTSIGHLAFSGCTSLNTIYNQSSLIFEKGSESYGSVAKYATTLVQGNATLTLGRSVSDPTQGTFATLSVKPGESVTLPEYTFTTQVSGTNKVTVITHTATGWTEQQ